jgi:hypothetical protein
MRVAALVVLFVLLIMLCAIGWVVGRCVRRVCRGFNECFRQSGPGWNR